MRKIFELIQNMGIRYILYRIYHEFEKKTGILKKKHEINPKNKYFISLANWKKLNSSFLITEREKLLFEKTPNAELRKNTLKIINGEIQFFSCQWIKLGLNYDWLTNPESNYRYDIKKHWSEIPDFNEEAGDIKYVWEKSRFTFLHNIIRNDYHNNEDHSEFVFMEIENWIDLNPINQGPNWRCSQEISLRILNWCYALHFYKNSNALTEDRWTKIQHVIYWSLHHVYIQIDFSRIAVRNNHAITETLFLTLSAQLFPFIPETSNWSRDGRKWFEKEIEFQIYNDGTFLQFSMNYHRVVVQLLSFGIAMTEKARQPFSEIVYKKAYKSVNFLYQCTQDVNGFLPNYGANDGAWFFQLSDSDYRDFRPQINSLHFILTGNKLYQQSFLCEEIFWFGHAAIANKLEPLRKQYGKIEFRDSGYFLIRETDTFTFIKCGSYKDRPSHADNLHIDIWVKDKNVLSDGGSYKYNTSENLIKYFSGTESHNTIMLDNYDQMLKGSRFIWYFWTKSIDAFLFEDDTCFEFKGKTKVFSYIDKKINHERVIIKHKNYPIWEIKDFITNKPTKMKLRQIWHSNFNNLFFDSTGQMQISKNSNSVYYGMLENINQIEFFTYDNKIVTKIEVK